MQCHDDGQPFAGVGVGWYRDARNLRTLWEGRGDPVLARRAQILARLLPLLRCGQDG